MGHRAYVDVIENGKTTVFYAHWGANDLTVVDRLWDAHEIRKEKKLNASLTDVMSHLEYEGDYNPEAPLNRRVFVGCDAEEIEDSKLSFEELGDIEMKITLNLDSQKINYNYDPERYGDNFPPLEITLVTAFKTLKEVVEWSDEETGFWDMADEFRSRIRLAA